MLHAKYKNTLRVSESPETMQVPGSFFFPRDTQRRNVNGVRLGSFAKPFRGRGSPQLRIYSQQIPDCVQHFTLTHFDTQNC